MALWLSSCSTTSNQTPGQPTSAAAAQKNWKARQIKLAKQVAWQLGGRASVSYRGDNWPFGIQWQQGSASQYVIHIKHPLTQNTLAKVSKTASGVTLKANGRTYSDSSPENLIQKHLHVRLPVNGMQYWVRGIPSTAYPVTAVKLDSRGRPLVLQQAGWTINYAKYQGADSYALPGLIKISRTTPRPVQVKMRIREWR